MTGLSACVRHDYSLYDAGGDFEPVMAARMSAAKVQGVRNEVVWSQTTHSQG